MHFIITSGATFEPWDDVRGITNRSKGTTGAKIAEQALLNGHSVDYIASDITKKPFELKINPENINLVDKLKSIKEVYKNYTFHKANTFDEYLDKSLTIPENHRLPVFISSAAVSDYSPVKVNGKVLSVKEQLTLELTKLPKVIERVKAQYPLMPIVGFKLLSEKTSSLNDLIEVAYKSLLDSKLALVVANLVDEDFKIKTTVIISPEKNITPVPDRDGLPCILVKMIEDRLSFNFYRTKVNAPFPKKLDLTDFNALLNECSDYSLFSTYGEGRKGAEFGAIAQRVGSGVLTTGRGTKKKNATDADFAVINDIKDNTLFISSDNTKATLNGSTLWHILRDRPEINYVVHSHVYMPKGVFIKETASPSTQEDYDIISSAVLNGDNVINQVGHGCFILLEDKNDLLNLLLDNGLYNSKFSCYYDIAYNRFKKGSLEKMVKSLNLDPTVDVLDLACGTGKSSQALLELGFKSVDLADASKDMLQVAEERIGVLGVVATFEDLTPIKKTYDLITIRQALTYLDVNKIEDFVSNIKKKLNQSGCLVFNTFKTLPEGKTSRFDQFDVSEGLIKTTENNIIEKDYIIHSQRTEYLNIEEGYYIPLYDINVFNQFNMTLFTSILEIYGFEVVIEENGNSICVLARAI